MKKKIIIALVAIFIGIQFIPLDKTNPEVNPEQDFFAVVQTDDEMKSLIKNACYDCHSNETVWPWYASIAPASFLIYNHVEEGRGHLNFSQWSTYETGKAHHKLEECTEVLLEYEMPMAGYVALHAEAKINEAQREALVEYFKSKMNELQP